ncbi:MAG: M14 family zinc carboxypeptidase [bacterium]|jgi:hypothetical protein
MKNKLFLILVFIFSNTQIHSQAIEIPYNLSNGNQTPSYEATISHYKKLAKKYDELKIIEFAYTDAAEPLHLVEIKKTTKTKNKVNILINNGIHPGEPEGIDASIILCQNILEILNNEKLTKVKYFKNNYELAALNDLLDHANLYIIPIYNVDGSKNRNSFSRANQNGPESYGFRANNKNLDLNRDFIKLDSKNAKAFTDIFHKANPHLFIDTHTSNGADYQHIVTYIATQRDKLNATIADYQYDVFMPELNKQLKDKKFDAVPYVNNWTDKPEAGWPAFYESPRYATGYSTLFNAIGFTLETHMLKSYSERVEGSYVFLLSCLKIANKDYELITTNKLIADADVALQDKFNLNWKLDTSSNQILKFKGYESNYKKSEIGDYNRLFYDRTKPFEKDVKFYNKYIPKTSVVKPKAYIIPFAWDQVIDRMVLNKVKFERVKKDTLMTVSVYYIEDYKTVNKPYEGHYLHSNVKLNKKEIQILVRKGDYIIYADQFQNRYIVETLEPEAVDSYFNWNFFDAILGQKEHFSDYVFEDTAAELLKNNKDLNDKFEKKKTEDAEFAKNKYAQLEYIYKSSEYFEKTFMRYPVYRLEK